MKLEYDCTNILENSKLPWIKYNMALYEHGDLSHAKELKNSLLQDNRIKQLLLEVIQWPDIPLKRHNDASHIIHKICLLLDFGLSNEDQAMREVAEKILANQSGDGAFLTCLNIPSVFGGSGKDSLEWIVCDFPILLYIVLKLGFEKDERVKKAVGFLKSIASDNGWRCVGSLEKFRGPGRKTDHCPYGTLVSLKAFSLLPQYHNDDFIRAGIDSILNHWKNQNERKIYMFGIGTDFRKLKYPNIWFDIVNTLRVLSKYKYARESNEFNEMLNIVREKQLDTGGFIPESIYMPWKGWDFGQKKVQSDSLTYQIARIFRNIE